MSSWPSPTPMREDELVGHAAPGDLAEHAHRLLERRGGVGGAEPQGPLALGRRSGRRRGSAWRRRPWRPRMALAPMPPMPTIDDGVGRAGVGGVDRRAPAGDHAAAEQARLVERHGAVDLDAAGLVDHGVVREGAEQAHGAEVVALGVVAGGAVADLLPLASSAPRSHRFEWPVAQDGQRPQDGMNAEHDGVAGREPRDLGADLLDDAGALVAADDRQLERAGHR